VIAGALCACAVAAQAAPELARVTTVSAPEGAEVEEALLSDLDADGRRDLLLVTAPGRKGPRTLRVHLARAGPQRFAQTPDLSLALTPDVVALAPGDVHADPGLEVVLLSARGAFAWRPRAAEDSARFVRLGEVDLLWQVGEGDDVLLWRHGVRDLDGDGLTDLFVPEPGGYRVLRQSRGAEGASFAAEAPLLFDPALLVSSEPGSVRTEESVLPGVERETDELSLSIGDEGAEANAYSGSLLALEERLPAPLLADWDADGDLDCLAQTQQELCVWRRGGSGFERLPLPFKVDRGRKFDVSYAAAVAELDGDGRADCVIFATTSAPATCARRSWSSRRRVRPPARRRSSATRGARRSSWSSPALPDGRAWRTSTGTATPISWWARCGRTCSRRSRAAERRSSSSSTCSATPAGGSRRSPTWPRACAWPRRRWAATRRRASWPTSAATA